MLCSNSRHDIMLSADTSCNVLCRQHPVQTQLCFTFTRIHWGSTLSSWAASGSWAGGGLHLRCRNSCSCATTSHVSLVFITKTRVLVTLCSLASLAGVGTYNFLLKVLNCLPCLLLYHAWHHHVTCGMDSWTSQACTIALSSNKVLLWVSAGGAVAENVLLDSCSRDGAGTHAAGAHHRCISS